MDASGDPIGYHLREALRLIEERHPEWMVRGLVSEALDCWERERRGE